MIGALLSMYITSPECLLKSGGAIPSLKVCPSSMILEPVVILFWLSKVSSTTKVGPTTVSQLIVVEIPAKSNNLLPAMEISVNPTGW